MRHYARAEPAASASDDAEGATAPDMPLGSSHWATLREILPYLWPADQPAFKWRVVMALVCLAVAKLATVAVPFFYKAAVDVLTGQTTRDAAQIIVVPVMLILAYGVTRLMMQGFAQLRDSIFAQVGQRALRQVALRAFLHLHALSLRFHLDRQTGGLSRIVERGTKGIDFLLRFTLFSVMPILIEVLLVTAIFYFQFDYRYAVVILVTVAAYVWFTFSLTERRTEIRRQMNDLDTTANTRAIDSLLNFETVKYFGNEAHEARRYDQAMAGYERASVKSQHSLSALNTGQAAFISLGLVAVMIMAGQGVVAHEHSIGDFVMVNAFLIQLYMPLNLLGTVYREIKQSLVDMETLFGLLEVSAEVKDAPGAQPLALHAGEVCFNDVRFHYEPERPILHGISFRVRPGGSVAIVGASGAGKSTLVRILFRFFEITGGSVTIDGQDIREVTQASLRQAIGIVPQDTVLFNDTIGYNIRYGKPGAADWEVQQAARHAQIHDFIAALPKGYDTMVGERGLKLSGGEKQRVAIARTILKDPPILVLDEATSALDTHTERGIQDALAELSARRTTLMIAHRLSTVVSADEILVLDQGRILERGTHSQLIASGGRYAAMWQQQRQATLQASDGLLASDDPDAPPDRSRVIELLN